MLPHRAMPTLVASIPPVPESISLVRWPLASTRQTNTLTLLLTTTAVATRCSVLPPA